MVLGGSGRIQLRATCPRDFHVRGRIRIAAGTSATLDLGGVDVILAGTNPQTESAPMSIHMDGGRFSIKTLRQISAAR